MNSSISLVQKFQEFGKDGIIYGLGAIAQKLIAFFLLPLYTTALTPTEYGVLGLITLTIQIGVMIYTLNISSGLFRSFYDYDTPQEQKVVVSTAFFITGISGLIFLVVGLIFADQLSYWLFETSQYRIYFTLAILTGFFSLFDGLMFTILRAQRKATQYTILQLTFLILNFGTIIFLVGIKQWGLTGVFLGQLIAEVFIVILLILTTKNFIALVFSYIEAKKMLSYSIPLVFAGLSGFVFTYIDRYFINAYLTLHEVGLYTLSYQLGMIVSTLLITPLKLTWGPIFLSAKDSSNLDVLCAKTLTYVFFVGGVITLAVSLLAKEAILILSDTVYFAAYTYVPIIALTYLIWSSRSIVEIGILIERKTKITALIMFLGAIINVILNFLLIPPYGVAGAAYATLVSFSIIIIIDYAYNQRLFKVHYEWMRLLKVSAVILILFFVGFLPEINSIILSLLYKISLIILYFLTLWGLRFFSVEEVTHIKRLTNSIPKFLGAS